MYARVTLLVVAIATPAVADPAEVQPKPYDIKALKDHMLVFQDGHGGTYVLTTDDDPVMFFGPAKTLYAQFEPLMSGRDGDAWTMRAVAPRMGGPHYGYIDRAKDGSFKKTCGGTDDAALTQLTGDKAKAVLDKYSFVTTGLIHLPELLARDDYGIYYYVDHMVDAYGGKGFRVFVGKKGAMKQLPLTDVASDSGGNVFATKTGDLRLVKATDQPEPSVLWIKGEKRTQLTKLDTYMNMQLIYTDLGIYHFLGSICENTI